MSIYPPPLPFIFIKASQSFQAWWNCCPGSSYLGFLPASFRYLFKPLYDAVPISHWFLLWPCDLLSSREGSSTEGICWTGLNWIFFSEKSWGSCFLSHRYPPPDPECAGLAGAFATSFSHDLPVSSYHFFFCCLGNVFLESTCMHKHTGILQCCISAKWLLPKTSQ